MIEYSDKLLAVILMDLKEEKIVAVIVLILSSHVIAAK